MAAGTGMEAVQEEVEMELKQHGRLLSPGDMEDGKPMPVPAPGKNVD